MIPARRMIQSSVALVLAAGIAACGDDSGTGNGNGDETVASVTVAPASPTLRVIGQTVQLNASARNAAGDVISGKTFTWMSANEKGRTLPVLPARSA